MSSAITWEEAEADAFQATLRAHTSGGVYFNTYAYINYMRGRYPTFEASHMIARNRDHGWSRLDVSSHLCTHRLRGENNNRPELSFMLAYICSLRRYLLDRLTDSELACVVEMPPPYVDGRYVEGRRVAQRELDLRTRGAFECSSLGQLPLPPELLQLIGQFHSPSITPAKPARLRPLSYTSAVAAIRAELAAAPDPTAGHARAASQMDALHHAESRKKQRHA